eukprot:m.79959 g.79959  ORF g.79959 m.79959 type:complete len:171 (-) comp12585_c1_seq1:2015-2527(-)
MTARTSVTTIALANPRGERLAEAQKMHYLPCTIHHTGSARVGEYFEPLIEEKGAAPQIGCSHGPPLQCTFRGRAICGRNMKVPAGTQGVWFQDSAMLQTDAADREFHAVSTFEEYNAWKLQHPLQESDAAVAWSSARDMLASLHKPLSPEEVEELSSIPDTSFQKPSTNE